MDEHGLESSPTFTSIWSPDEGDPLEPLNIWTLNHWSGVAFLLGLLSKEPPRLSSSMRRTQLVQDYILLHIFSVTL